MPEINFAELEQEIWQIFPTNFQRFLTFLRLVTFLRLTKSKDLVKTLVKLIIQ